MKFNDTWEPMTVAATRDITPTIRLFEIRGRDDAARSWTPGSHIRVRVAVDGRTEIRCYSLVDIDDSRSGYRIAVRLSENGLGGSRAMWALKLGDPIEVSGPENFFELGYGAPSYTLVAGGVGITPMIGMARLLAKTGQSVRLFHAVREPEEAAFSDLLQMHLGDRFTLCVESQTGRLDFAKIIEGIDADGELYLCGPLGMLDAARKAWAAAGHPLSLLRFESFASGGNYANQPFTVALPRFGREIHVPANQSLLAALEAAGIETLSDCRRGECGLCSVDILSCDSPIDHRDSFLSDHQKAQNRKLCACVSRAAGGRLEIDTAYRGPTRRV